MFSIFKKKGNKHTLRITNLNIKMGGETHGIKGSEFDTSTFKLSVPFQNKVGSGLLPDGVRGQDIRITSIVAEQPFQVIDVKPKLPVSVAYLSKMVFDITAKGPEGNYEGPMYLKFDTDEEGVVVNVEKITLKNGSKSYELENSTESMKVRKGQILRRDLQAYKILSYGSEVKSVEISTPFSIYEVQPKLPFRVDVKDSYMIRLYIKAPEFSYSGPIEISFD